MGPWFVIGAIRVGVKKDAHDAVETYTLNPDGTVATVFQFRADSFDSESKSFVTKAWAKDNTGNAASGTGSRRSHALRVRRSLPNNRASRYRCEIRYCCFDGQIVCAAHSAD